MSLGIRSSDTFGYTIIESPAFDGKQSLYEEWIIPLINEAYWKQQQHFFNDTPAARERMNVEKMRKILTDPTKRLYLMIKDTLQEVVGTILFEERLGKNKATFGLFAIAAEHQGKGLGHAMLAHIEEVARIQNKQIMKIKVFVFAERLRGYYECLGYRYTGKSSEFFHGDSIREEYRNRISDQRYLLQMEKKIA